MDSFDRLLWFMCKETWLSIAYSILCVPLCMGGVRVWVCEAEQSSAPSADRTFQLLTRSLRLNPSPCVYPAGGELCSIRCGSAAVPCLLQLLSPAQRCRGFISAFPTQSLQLLPAVS